MLFVTALSAAASVFLVLSTVLGNNDETELVLVGDPEESQSNNFDIVKAAFQESKENFVDPHAEPFIPTKEWQIVEAGQSIPAGLHVRMNFQTHLKEAKLMDGDDGERFAHLSKKSTPEVKAEESDKVSEKQPKIVLSDEIKQADSFESSDKLYFTKQHLKEALKDFRDKFHHETDPSDGQEISRNEAVKKKFRSIDEIRKDLEDHMGMSIKSDAQIMKVKIDLLKAENATEEEKLNSLEDLEYYVHQIDNAVDLEKMHGFKVVIDFLNDSSVKLQEKAAKVVGAAVQSNPKAQLAALEHGAMSLLLRQVSYSHSEQLRKTALFALSALVRANSRSQIVFLKFGGLETLMKLIQQDSSRRLKIKSITLISDLVVEQNDVKQSMVKNGKMSENERTPLMRALVQQNWCDLLPVQLKAEDYDSIEKVLGAISASASDCREVFNKTDLRGMLVKIRSRFMKEIDQEEDEDFRSYLRTFPERVDKIINDLGKYVNL